MATQTEKTIQTLQTEVAVLRERVETLRSAAQSTQDLIPQVAVLKSQLDELTKTKDLWGQRRWAILTVALTATASLVTGLMIALVNYLLNTKK